jgi:hypothetical protein
MSMDSSNYTNIGFIDHPLSYGEVNALPFTCDGECSEGAPISCYLPMGLDVLTDPDDRGLVYDIEALIVGDRCSWTLEDVSYEPVFVDEHKNIVFSVKGTIWPV